MKKWLKTSGIAITLAALAGAAPYSYGQVEQEDEIVVTGVRVSGAIRLTQGGAQDIAFFRDSVDDGTIPAPASITSEGLFSEHDMVLNRTAPCKQLFCLTIETMKADLISAPETKAVMGLGFATDIDSETWKRAPTTIMAVVDTSGSMSGAPLELAKASLRETLVHLRAGDRIGLAHYGSTTSVILPVTTVGSDRSGIIKAIDSLESNGSTDMESGLELAFETAEASMAAFKGTTRVMLFTDEQPNVGDTDAESFIGMAKHASKKGIGLTTIGVADHFGADLANQISAARGGNLFYVENKKDVKTLFGQDFDFLVTEVAHDLKVSIKPKKGVKIAEVFGLPGEDLKRSKKGNISFTIPSVFLSSKGGGIFLALDGAVTGDASLADISLSYVSATDKKTGREFLTVSGITDAPSEGLALGHLLTDEFQVLRQASLAHVFNGDRVKALETINAFQSKLELRDDEALDDELDLIENVAEILENHIENSQVVTKIDDQEKSDKQYVADNGVYGAWTIKRVKNTSNSISGKGSIDLRKGDLLAFDLAENVYDETETFHAQRLKPKGNEPRFEVESMAVDPEKSTITLYESDIVFKYKKTKTGLTLRPQGTDLVMTLARP